MAVKRLLLTQLHKKFPWPFRINCLLWSPEILLFSDYSRGPRFKCQWLCFENTVLEELPVSFLWLQWLLTRYAFKSGVKLLFIPRFHFQGFHILLQQGEFCCLGLYFTYSITAKKAKPWGFFAFSYCALDYLFWWNWSFCILLYKFYAHFIFIAVLKENHISTVIKVVKQTLYPGLVL